MAEGLFIHHAKQAHLLDQYQIDSCGTGSWHIGERPDRRMQAEADKHQVHLPSVSRQLKPADVQTFDYIVAMDHNNHADVQQMIDAHHGTAKLLLMRDFDEKGKGKSVPDPYYVDGFDGVYEILDRSTLSLLTWLEMQN